MPRYYSSNSRHISITNSDVRPYVSPGSQSAGLVRYNSGTQNLEIYDGVTWHQFDNGSVTVNLAQETEDLLNWARGKRAEEAELKLLIESSPAAKDLIEKLEIVKALLKEEKSGSS